MREWSDTSVSSLLTERALGTIVLLAWAVLAQRAQGN